MPNGDAKLIDMTTGHRTKAEKAFRKQGEESLKTKTPMREWPEVKEDPVAHKMFQRIRKLLKAIEHDDAIHEAAINRYCQILAECGNFENEIERLELLREKLEEKECRMEFKDYIRAAIDIEKQINTKDKLLQQKRAMLLNIEKENIMTICSQLRAVPKTPPKKGAPGGIEGYRQRRAGNG